MLFVVRPIQTERAPLAGLRRWSPQAQQVPLTSQFSDTRVLPRFRVLDRVLVDAFRNDHGLIGKEFHDILHPSNRMCASGVTPDCADRVSDRGMSQVFCRRFHSRSLSRTWYIRLCGLDHVWSTEVVASHPTRCASVRM